MPVYDQSYRTYKGTLRSRGRWAVIVGQEIRVLRTRRMFTFLVLLGNFHFALRVLQIFVMGVLSQNPASGGLPHELSQLQFEETGAWVYFDFLRMQSPLIFLTLIYSGSGQICNDFRNNLMEIYFSKPINWRDYVAGKVMALMTVGLGLTALPAIILAVIHLLFNPSLSVLTATLSSILPIIAFALLMVGSFSLVILASSALVDSGKFAGVAVFMLTLINITIGVLLAVLLDKQNYLVVAYPVSLNNVGETLFHNTRYPNPTTVPWYWSAMYIAVVCTTALAIICRKARRAETGR